jgi:glycosyltransferase involved in cell wall biosynthesis
MIRVGVFSKPLDNWTSGSGHHLNEILTHALDLNDAEPRVEFTFIHYAKSENPIYRRVRELLIPRNPLAAAMALRKEQFDILHHAPLTIFSPIWFVKSKRMATIHGAEQLLNPQLYGAVEMAHERLVVPFYARRMDAIVTVSETSRTFFAERFGVDPGRISVCYNGLAPDYRELPAAEVQAPGKLGIEGPYILHLSRFSERKNPWTMMAAIARLRETDPRARSYRFVCAGKGWDGEEARRRAAEYGIADAYVAPGFIDRRTAVELMNGARAFLFPSLAEGFGMPNVEAMACACPVVTSRVFAIPEVVGDAAVILDDPKDAPAMAAALASACFDEALRASLIEKGRSRLHLFSWEESAGKLLDVYGALAAGRSLS